LGRMDENGMLISERTATKESYQDREVGEDGSLLPPKSIREIQRMSQRQVDGIEPVSSALVKLAKIIGDAADLRRNPPGGTGTEGPLSMRQARDLMLDVFGDSGALEAAEDTVESSHDANP
jgi:hypothetical protein